MKISLSGLPKCLLRVSNLKPPDAKKPRTPPSPDFSDMGAKLAGRWQSEPMCGVGVFFWGMVAGSNLDFMDYGLIFKGVESKGT